MYQGKMAAAIKVGGKILREVGETVYLPFGSEYSITLKNLNNRKACVKLTIDGQEIVDGGLIVNASSSVDLERFVKAGQLSQGNRLKFIERNSKVEATRGIGVEDGLLRIEFEFEKAPVYFYPQNPQNSFEQYPYTKGLIGNYDARQTLSTTSGTMFASATSTGAQDTGFLGNVFSRSVPVSDAGITVAGSVSDQKFTSVSFVGDGESTVMVLKLLGETETAPVVAPVTVKTKAKCTTCGHVNKATAKFCSECGTGLTIV